MEPQPASGKPLLIVVTIVFILGMVGIVYVYLNSDQGASEANPNNLDAAQVVDLEVQAAQQHAEAQPAGSPTP